MNIVAGLWLLREIESLSSFITKRCKAWFWRCAALWTKLYVGAYKGWPWLLKER